MLKWNIVVIRKYTNTMEYKNMKNSINTNQN